MSNDRKTIIRKLGDGFIMDIMQNTLGGPGSLDQINNLKQNLPKLSEAAFGKLVERFQKVHGVLADDKIEYNYHANGLPVTYLCDYDMQLYFSLKGKSPITIYQMFTKDLIENLRLIYNSVVDIEHRYEGLVDGPMHPAQKIRLTEAIQKKLQLMFQELSLCLYLTDDELILVSKMADTLRKFY